jgi:hypothetical protein
LARGIIEPAQKGGRSQGQDQKSGAEGTHTDRS